MAIERKVLFTPLTKDEREIVINSYQETRTIKGLTQLINDYKTNINLRSGVITQPDVNNFTVTGGKYAFTADLKWRVMDSGKTAQNIHNDLRALAVELIAEIDKRDNAGLNTTGSLNIAIDIECS